MAFDFNEARQIIEEAKKRGLISAPGSKLPSASAPSPDAPAKVPAGNAVIPDWLQQAISDPAPPGDASSSRDALFSSRE